ncbi:unnamed protein product [Cyprideis torosa]|uniref:Uncharacterized protein n=1 Tax=Cyprideis torosa TaxID=163714 RepID=A0A7R8WD03_9CRUS|nr:unnamed protein product [Cyprideis torosa]CAG0888035.1 unnamed protein product [Cyprideis torosa]
MDQRPLPPLVIPSIELTSPEVTDSEEDSRRDSSNLKEVKLPFDGLKSTLEDSKISSPDSEHSKSSSSIRHAIDKDTSAHIKIVFKWSAIACSIFLVPLAVIVFNITDDVGEFAKYFSTMTAIVILFTVPVTHFYVVRRRKAVEATRQEAKEAALQLEKSAFHMNNLEYEEPDMNLHMTPYLQNGMRPAIMPSMSMSSHPGSPAAIVELPQTPEPRRHNPFLSLEAPSAQRPRIDGHLYRPQSLRSLHDFRETPASPHALTHARSTSTLPRIQKTSLHELHAPHRRPLQRPQSMHSLQQSFDDQLLLVSAVSSPQKEEKAFAQPNSLFQLIFKEIGHLIFYVSQKEDVP